MEPSSDNPGPAGPKAVTLVGRFHYILTILVGALLMLVIGIPIIFSSMLARALFGIEDFVFPVAKRAVRVFVYATGARINLTGLANADPSRTYLFVANHQSNLDPAILFGWLRHNIGGIAKRELEKIPFFKQGFSVAHIVPIDRKNRESAIESTRRGAEKLRQGHSLMAFPEGTRSADGRLKDFKKGVFYMAIEAGTPIIPIAINNTRLVMPKIGHVVIPGPVSIAILPPISTSGYTVSNIHELIDKVKGEIARHVDQETS